MHQPSSHPTVAQILFDRIVSALDWLAEHGEIPDDHIDAAFTLHHYALVRSGQEQVRPIARRGRLTDLAEANDSR